MNQMFKLLSKLAVVALLACTSLSAQQRSQTVPVTTSNPALGTLVADVHGQNFTTFTVVGFVARAGSFQFGSGTIDSFGTSEDTTIGYESLGITFKCTPDASWFYWTAGIGSVLFTAEI